jgi:hypothetical protein
MNCLSIVIFFVPILVVAILAGRSALNKGHKEAYLLLGFCEGVPVVRTTVDLI